ncbi:hypothetical protein [Mycoplasma sp. 2248]|uniref:hypothetical protein n=1 Tax=Mycoplasma sp. 2248 TaxID=3108528 RepID=UPI002B1D7399|nr:hypothetical protein [Mycoplasma sp. 2248]MEA4190897.1 hypothetical protein [Mycoplasma sp. 2248]
MEFILTKKFLWELFVAEFLAVTFLSTMSLLLTYVGKKYVKLKFIFPFTYGLATLAAGLLSYFILRGVVYQFENDLYNDISKNVPPVINPVVSLFYVFIYLFNKNLNNQTILFLNLFLLFLAHMLASIVSGNVWGLISRKYKKLQVSNMNKSSIKTYSTLKDVSQIIIFASILFAIQHTITENLNSYVMADTIAGLTTYVALLACTLVFKEFSFPTNIYVCAGSFFASLHTNKKNWHKNLLYTGIVASTYILISIILSGIYAIAK